MTPEQFNRLMGGGGDPDPFVIGMSALIVTCLACAVAGWVWPAA